MCAFFEDHQLAGVIVGSNFGPAAMTGDVWVLRPEKVGTQMIRRRRARNEESPAVPSLLDKLNQISFRGPAQDGPPGAPLDGVEATDPFEQLYASGSPSLPVSQCAVRSKMRGQT
jgi:hypothetical protein